MSRLQRIELLLFTACFFGFGFFHQGGGWNQNARFAEVRAMVEEGRFAIDNFLVYEVVQGSDVLRRNQLNHAQYQRNGKRFELAWVDMVWNLRPVHSEVLAEGVESAPMVEICASGDIGYVPATGHFHPNKPPGTSFFGVPAYFILFHVERWLGINPDHWWILTLNAWLTTLGSVGLASALACVVFFRLAQSFSAGGTLPATLATLAFGFGTTFFPFATIFFDHSLTSALLLAAFYFLRCRPTPLGYLLAGTCAGFAAVTNYVAAVAGIFLGFYVLLGHVSQRRNWRGSLLYMGGVLGPFVLICAYAWICFGSPFRINNDFQNPLFKETDKALFGMFAIPRSVDALARLGYIGGLLTLSPFRGLFFLAPVLTIGLWGQGVWLREKSHVAEARLCLAIFGFFLLVNVTFNGYHGGFAAGPRYLVPGIPFLALGLVVAFERWRKVSSGLAVISVCNQLLLTATDGQSPVGVGGHARVEGTRDEWDYNLITDYAWPLFWTGKAWPLLNEQLQQSLAKEQERINEQIEAPAERIQEGDRMRSVIMHSIEQGASSPLLLASVQGPVSVNPLGVFEGMFTYKFFPPDSAQCQWASFNVGEFIFPRSTWSLLPLLLVSGGLSALAVGLSAQKNKLAPRPRDCLV
jgi:hypothetical protein